MPHFIFIQQISVLNILNMLYNLHFFSSKCRLFHNATLFGFCITLILNTVCAKIWKEIRRQKVNKRFHRSYKIRNTYLTLYIIHILLLHGLRNIEDWSRWPCRQGIAMHATDSWDRGFECSWRHWCLSVLFVVFCVGSCHCSQPIIRPEEFYRMVVRVI